MKVHFAVFSGGMVICALLYVSLSGCASSGSKGEKYEKIEGALGTMMELSESQKKMQGELDKETRSYRKIKRAIENGAVKKGEYTSQIAKEYGLPAVVIEGDKGIPDKWIYKPGGKSYFSGDKVTMMFGDNGELTDWQIPPDKNKP